MFGGHRLDVSGRGNGLTYGSPHPRAGLRDLAVKVITAERLAARRSLSGQLAAISSEPRAGIETELRIGLRSASCCKALAETGVG